MGCVAILIIRAITDSTVVARKVVNNSIAFNLAYKEERLTELLMAVFLILNLEQRYRCTTLTATNFV